MLIVGERHLVLAMKAPCAGNAAVRLPRCQHTSKSLKSTLTIFAVLLSLGIVMQTLPFRVVARCARVQTCVVTASKACLARPACVRRLCTKRASCAVSSLSRQHRRHMPGMPSHNASHRPSGLSSNCVCSWACIADSAPTSMCAGLWSAAA